MCRVQLKNRKIYTDLMLIFSETIDQSVMENSDHWHGHV